MPVRFNSEGSRSTTPDVATDVPLETLGYAVGKNKPPVHSRFKPGGRGGPGRPKGAKNRKTLLREALDTPRLVTLGGRKCRKTPTELGYHQLATKLANGDLKALVVAEALRDRLLNDEDRVAVVVEPLSPAELAILGRRS